MARMPSFNKFLTVDFHEYLQIPPAFLKHFDGVFPKNFSLWTPTGGPWHVLVIKIENNLFFGKGWREFVQEHYLVSNDSLVFKYDGNSKFYVTIYGTNFCEKDISNVARNDGNKEVEKTSSRTDARCSYAVSMESQNKMDKKGLKESNGNEANLVQPIVNDDVVLIEDLDEIAKCLKKRKKAPLQSKRVTNSHSLARESREIGNKLKGLKPTTKRTLRATNKTKALHIAKDFKSENPFFVVAMQPSYVTGRALSVPASFSSKYFSEVEKNVILLTSDGRSWSTKGIYKVHEKRLSSQLYCGWSTFVRGNNLEVGDVCVFELVNISEMCFKVVIF